MSKPLCLTCPTFVRSLNCSVAALLLALLPVTASLAQDAGPWQEIEIVVFSHEDRASQVSERPVADPSQLGWLPRLAELRSPASNLVYPFPQALADTLFVDDPLDTTGLQQNLSVPGPAPVYGPQPAPSATRSFRLLDISRDPFLALGPDQALLDQDARRIGESVQHRVLWHATWRQPRVAAGQTRSVLVTGGERHGERHELEGSLRLTDSGGRAQLELRLWYSSFVPQTADAQPSVALPELPALVTTNPETGSETRSGITESITLQQDLAGMPDWVPGSVWALQDVRLLTEDAFHYIDHPAIGVLVQLRPYALPPLAVPGVREDF